VDAYARRTQGAPLAELSAEKRDQVLTAIDTNTADGLPAGRAFFNRARRLTLEGMFGDPYYGGNKNFAGWDLIKYPGPRPATGPEHQKMTTPDAVSQVGVQSGFRARSLELFLFGRILLDRFLNHVVEMFGDLGGIALVFHGDGAPD
jgi:Gluconate 2-dehydrogenase subunit 3